MFCLLYKHTKDDYFTISRRFPKILQKLSEGQTNVSEHVRKFSKISEKDPMMFRSHSNTSKFSLSYYVTMAMVIFSISSHKIVSSLPLPTDSVVCFVNTYPLVGDLSGG